MLLQTEGRPKYASEVRKVTARNQLDTAHDRRVRGMHIGAALRHARAAASLNLDGAPVDEIRREAGHALDCLCVIVWPNDKER